MDSMSKLRGRGDFTSMISAMRPGRGDITTTRSASITASGIECVTNSTVLGCSLQMRSSSRVISSRVNASSAPNGSSMSRMSGRGPAPGRCRALLHAARQLARRFALEAREPDELQQRRCARSVLSGVDPFIMRSGNSTFSMTLAHGSRVGDWKTMPVSGRGSAIGSPPIDDARRGSTGSARRRSAAASICRSPTGRRGRRTRCARSRATRPASAVIAIAVARSRRCGDAVERDHVARLILRT